MKQMHKLLIVLFLAVLCTSCSKTQCWECTVDIGGTAFQEEVCDKSKKEIEELQNTPQETKDKDGQVILITSYSNCAKR